MGRYAVIIPPKGREERKEIGMKKQILALVLAMVVLACALTALAEGQMIVNGMVITMENGAVTAQTALDGTTDVLPGGEMTVEDTLVHQVSEAGSGVRVQSVTGEEGAPAEGPETVILCEEDDLGEMPPELAALLAAYEPFGILMDETGAFTYEGKPVRSLTDIRSMSADGEILSLFSVCSEMGEEGVDLEIVRDYTRTDAFGDGIVLEVKVV